MPKSYSEPQLYELLEEAYAKYTAAANLQRLRAILATRFRLHPNSAALCSECERYAAHYMASFDADIYILLDRAWPNHRENGGNNE